MGKGAFGEVRIAEHKQAKIEVALKIIEKRKMSLRDIELSRNEIETLRLCQHPSIIRLYDVLENSDDIFIAMELITGGDLLNYLNKKQLKIGEVCSAKITLSLAKALQYLRNLGIVHRDLKPENILMVDDSNVKIVDFGLAALLGPKEKCKKFVGTLSYAAPEILLGFPYDYSADVWSLGVIVYFMLSGTSPFPDHETLETKKTYILNIDYL